MDALAGAPIEVTVRLTEVDGVDTLEVVDNAADAVVESRPLAGTTAVVINGSDRDDRVTIVLGNPFSLPGGITVNDPFSADRDTLAIIGPEALQWDVTGRDSGHAGIVAFAGIEYLAGGENNEDTFIVGAGGGPSGTLDGGPASFDSLVIEASDHETAVYAAYGPDSGTVALDGRVITYAGLEPIANHGTADNATYNATAGKDVFSIFEIGGQIKIKSGNGTFEDTTFDEPSTSLTVDAGAEDDIIEFKLLDFDAQINIDGGPGNDTLDLTRAAALTVVREPSDGSALVVSASGELRVLNVEMFIGADSTTYNATAGADQFAIVASPSTGAIRIESDNGTFEDTTFAEPLASLTVNAGDGDDTITPPLFELLSFPNIIIIDGGPGNDTLDLSSIQPAAVARFSDGSVLIERESRAARILNVETYSAVRTTRA